MDKLLEKLVGAFKVSSHEKEVRTIIKEELKDIKGEIIEDKLGNLIVKVGSGKDKIMISTAMDETGLIVTFIDEDGFVRVDAIGDINPETIINKKVVLNNGTFGIVCSTKEKPAMGDLFIDFGVDSREEALKVVNEGDPIKIQGEVFELCKDKIAGSGLSNISLVYTLINLLKENMEFNKEVSFVFSSQGKLEGRGGRAAAYEVKPDYTIVLSTEESGDYIDGSSKLELGKGPVLVIKDKNLILSHELEEIVEKASKKSKIDIQRVVSKDGTEGGPIHKELGGIRTGVLSLPIRYKNSFLEVVSKSDIESMKSLLQNIIA